MKRILSILLVIVFCIGVCPFNAVAANEDIIASVKGGNVQKGGTITVPVFLDVNKGFVTLGIKISYDAQVLEIVCENHEEGKRCINARKPAIENKTDFAVAKKYNCGNQGFHGEYHTSNPYRIQWAFGTIKEDICETGQIAAITFRVKNTAEIGDTKVTVEIDQASCYSKTPRTFTGGEATIKVVNCTNHTNDAGSITKNPTCTEKGVKTYKCTFCGAVAATEDINALGHNFGEWTKTKEATCGAAGEETRVCSNDASHKETREIKALDHKFGEWVKTKEATCGAAGEETRVCSNDASHKETREIKALDHKFGEWTKTKEATCGAAGEETRVCSNDASHKETREIKALDHKFGEWTKTKEPTCSTAGEETRVCSNDASHKETREIKALGHKFGEWKVDKAATCTSEGEETRVCSNDASHKETRKIAKARHTVNWQVTKEPTTKSEGERKGTCSVCGNSVIEKIPKLTTTIDGDKIEFVTDDDETSDTNTETNSNNNNNSNSKEELPKEDFKVDSADDETFSGYVKAEIKESFPKADSPIKIGDKTVAAIYSINLRDVDNDKVISSDRLVALTIPVRKSIIKAYENLVLAGVDENGKYVVLSNAKFSNNKFVITGKYGSLSKLLIAGNKIVVEEDGNQTDTKEENQSDLNSATDTESNLTSDQSNTSSEEEVLNQGQENIEATPTPKSNTTAWAIGIPAFLAIAFALVFISMRKRF